MNMYIGDIEANKSTVQGLSEFCENFTKYPFRRALTKSLRERGIDEMDVGFITDNDPELLGQLSKADSKAQGLAIIITEPLNQTVGSLITYQTFSEATESGEANDRITELMQQARQQLTKMRNDLNSLFPEAPEAIAACLHEIDILIGPQSGLELSFADTAEPSDNAGQGISEEPQNENRAPEGPQVVNLG